MKIVLKIKDKEGHEFLFNYFGEVTRKYDTYFFDIENENRFEQNIKRHILSALAKLIMIEKDVFDVLVPIGLWDEGSEGLRVKKIDKIIAFSLCWTNHSGTDLNLMDDLIEIRENYHIIEIESFIEISEEAYLDYLQEIVGSLEFQFE